MYKRQDLCHFLVSTGARLGEVLHAEWQDFDLTKRIWRIVHKPECPTSKGLGWYPKWKKSQVIELIPEARLVLDNLPGTKRPGGVTGMGIMFFGKEQTLFSRLSDK